MGGAVAVGTALVGVGCDEGARGGTGLEVASVGVSVVGAGLRSSEQAIRLSKITAAAAIVTSLCEGVSTYQSSLPNGKDLCEVLVNRAGFVLRTSSNSDWSEGEGASYFFESPRSSLGS